MTTVQIVSKEVSDILSLKFSDLSDDYDPCEAYFAPVPARSTLRSRLTRSPHPRLLHDDLDVYPASYSKEEYLRYLDEDSFIISMTPLRAERILYAKATPSRGIKRGGRAEIKRLRQKYFSANLKHKFLHLCGASKAMFSSKYVGLPV